MSSVAETIRSTAAFTLNVNILAATNTPHEASRPRLARGFIRGALKCLNRGVDLRLRGQPPDHEHSTQCCQK